MFSVRFIEILYLTIFFNCVLSQNKPLDVRTNIRHSRSKSRLPRERRQEYYWNQNFQFVGDGNVHGFPFHEFLLATPTNELGINQIIRNELSNISQISHNPPFKESSKETENNSPANRQISVASSSQNPKHNNSTWQQQVGIGGEWMGEASHLSSENSDNGKARLSATYLENKDEVNTEVAPLPPDGQEGDLQDATSFKGTRRESSYEKSISENVKNGYVDIVTRFLRIVESQHLLGENCTAGTDLNLGEGVVDRYAQERFRVEADVAVNRANMLTRLWKYTEPSLVLSEYLLHASVFSMVEFDDDIFAAGNCYDQYQYKNYWLFCPYAYRLPEGTILVKDLAVEYKYLSNTSEWFYIARKNAENVIRNYNQFSRGYNMYQYNESAHTDREPDEILSVRYEDGKWSKPYYDCGGGNIWMLTYTVPFFGFRNNTYFFKGTSGIDIDLRRVDIDQCPLPKGSTQLNIFAASDKCKKKTTECVPISGLGFRRGSYKCLCKRGFYFPDTTAERRYYNGTIIEEEYEKLIMGEKSQYNSEEGLFECLPCPEGCESCEDDRPCVVSLNWVMRTVILVLSCVIICCLPIVLIFTWKYGNVKVVRAASPVLLRVIILGAFFIYCTMIVMYPRPSVYTCTARVWLREIGFALTYGALMLKTWRISVIFRVRSAKAVKITDMNLLKRLGAIVAIFTAFLVIRTLVAPPVVIVGRTAEDLKAYLCKNDWWDHSFTTLEVLFLVWGIRLCIVVRKAPSEFNESRFISVAIYNEFLLSVFLNISMLFLQKPANPDLLYIIFFCHTQLTVTLLLCIIFGSKAYMVFKNSEHSDDSSGMMSKTATSKFLGKARSANSQYTSTNSSIGNLEYAKFSEEDVQEEFLRLYTQLELLKEKNMRIGNRHLALKISAMQDAARNHSNCKQLQGNTLCVVQEKSGKGYDQATPSKSKRQSVTFCKETGGKDEILEKTVEEDGEEEDKEKGISLATEDEAAVSEPPAGACLELKGKEAAKECSSSGSERNGRQLKSGHARTHAIVINLDDKSRFTEEITV